jgi:hypothetical protein
VDPIKGNLARLDRLLTAGRADQQLYSTTVPQLPERLIVAYGRTRPRAFAQTLVALSDHTRPPLPYELCEELASFYATVFRVCSRDSHRRLALAQLLALGPTHRCYAVADVVRELLRSLRRRREVELAAEVLERSPWSGWYAHPRTLSASLHPRLLWVLVRARAAPPFDRPAGSG